MTQSYQEQAKTAAAQVNQVILGILNLIAGITSYLSYSTIKPLISQAKSQFLIRN